MKKGKVKINKAKLKSTLFWGKFLCMNVIMTLMIYQPVFAEDKTKAPAEPIIITGSRLLLAALTGIITGFVTSVGALKALTVGTQWINANPEEKPKYQKELLRVIGITIIVLTSGSTLTYIVGFYSGK